MERSATLSRRAGATGGGLLLLASGPVPREVTVTLRQAVLILPYAEASDWPRARPPGREHLEQQQPPEEGQ